MAREKKKDATFPPTAFISPPVPSLSINVPAHNLSDHIFHLEHEVPKIRSSNSGQHLIYDWNKNLSGQFLMLMERQQNLHSGTVAILAVTRRFTHRNKVETGGRSSLSCGVEQVCWCWYSLLQKNTSFKLNARVLNWTKVTVAQVCMRLMNPISNLKTVPRAATHLDVRGHNWRLTVIDQSFTMDLHSNVVVRTLFVSQKCPGIQGSFQLEAKKTQQLLGGQHVACLVL